MCKRLIVLVCGICLLLVPALGAQEDVSSSVVSDAEVSSSDVSQEEKQDASSENTTAASQDEKTKEAETTDAQPSSLAPVSDEQKNSENVPPQESSSAQKATDVGEQKDETQIAENVAPRAIESQPDVKAPMEVEKPAEETLAPAPVSAPEVPNGKQEELAGIDTVNVDEPAGNWLYKRLYWERAEDKYQKIKELMSQIFDARTKFFDQRVKLDKEIFDPLYNAANFSRGELSSVLKDLLDEIEQQKQRNKEELDDNARALFAKIEGNRERLEEVKKEIEFINKIDDAVDQAINKLLELLNQGRNFEMQAWGDFKSISRELSDKKARDLFYRIDTHWRNVKDIQVYITTKLAEHMNYLASTAQQHADIVRGLLKELEQEGFVLKEQVDALEKTKIVKPETEEVVKPKIESRGFFGKIGNFFGMLVKPFVAFAKALWHTITIPFNYFFGQKKPAQPESVPAAPEVVSEGVDIEKQALPKAS